MLAAFAATVLLSAGLLFVLEPMFARMALPRLGGSPAVWNTALVFYQLALLAGYGWVHWSTSRLGVRRQALLQVALLAAAALFLPVAVPADWTPPPGRNPAPWFLGLLAVSVGAPFLAISTTAPLIQKWLAATRHARAGDPYFLYAASNLGSVLGLLAYPLLLEPNLRLADQSRLWSWGYALLAALTLACAILVWRRAGPGVAVVARAAPPADGPATDPPGLRRRLRWLALAFAPSSLMMAVTAHITTDVAAMPLLWVIPLGLYLLSFILVFARRPPIPHVLATRALPLLLLPLLLVIVGRPAQPVIPIMSFHLLVLLVAALVCHGELARDRPAPRHLTDFYLWIAAGGALGGVFNAIVAPLAFRSVAEYPIALVLACMLAPARRPGPSTRASRILDVALPAAVAAVVILVEGGLAARGVQVIRELQVIVVALLVFPVFSFSGRPIRFGLGVGALLATHPGVAASGGQVLHAERSFFGVHRVVASGNGKFHDLWHGTTLHGVQWVRPRACREPLGYYGREGPLGEVFRALPRSGGGRSVAVAGLGAGACAAYAEPGDRWTFFEIDPAVARIAGDPRWFCYLADCPVALRVVLGDARLSMAGSRDRFDLILLDAYTSDAIPVHLLTREALRVYLDRLAEDGLLVFHISNKFFDLAPVVARLATDAGLACRVNETGNLADDELAAGLFPSVYAVAARSERALGALATGEGWAAPGAGPRAALWTDDHASPFSVLRRP